MFKFKKIWLVSLLLVGFFALAGCDNMPWNASKPAKTSKTKAPPAGATVVARVGNFYITSEDLAKEVENFNAVVAAQGVPQNKLDTQEKRSAYLKNEMVRKYILYQEALDRGLDKREDIVRSLENAKIGLLVSELLRQEIEKIDVNSKEIEDFYNQNKEAIKEPEQRKISEIVTSTEADAKQVYIEMLKGGDFGALAKQYSKAASASKGGDLGYLTIDPDPKKRIKFDKFYEVAFSPTLDAGETSNIFKGPDGFYIVRLDTIKKPEAKPLSELRDNIKNWLLFEKQQKAIADLASKLSGETKIEVFEGKVE